MKASASNKAVSFSRVLVVVCLYCVDSTICLCYYQHIATRRLLGTGSRLTNNRLTAHHTTRFVGNCIALVCEAVRPVAIDWTAHVADILHRGKLANRDSTRV